MNPLRLLPLLALPSVLLATTRSERSLGGLHYRVKVQFMGDAVPTEARFVVEPTPVLVTQNRSQKPRLGGWRLQGIQKKPGTFSMGALLARVERMLYLSGPAPGTVLRPIVVRFGGRSCPLWQVLAPANLQVYAYLAEVRPGLLALSYLSGCFSQGDISSLELQLEDFTLAPGVGPAEGGLALLGTLQRMAQEALESKPDGITELVRPD